MRTIHCRLVIALYHNLTAAQRDMHAHKPFQRAYILIVGAKQILDLLRQLKDKINSSIMLITHDLGVVANMADYVVVMYAGRVIEKGTAEDIFHNPCHPYTIGLMKSKPVVGKKVEELYNIPGSVPNPVNMPDYCYFKDRCEMQCEHCKGMYPPEIKISDTHFVSCYRYFEQGEVMGYPKSTNVEEL